MRNVAKKVKAASATGNGRRYSDKGWILNGVRNHRTKTLPCSASRGLDEREKKIREPIVPPESTRSDREKKDLVLEGPSGPLAQVRAFRRGRDSARKSGPRIWGKKMERPSGRVWKSENGFPYAKGKK